MSAATPAAFKVGLVQMRSGVDPHANLAAALAVIDAIARLVPGVLGNELSAQSESFSGEGLLEGPQYTRPPEFRGLRVPEVLLSGDHEKIARWRQEQAVARTRERRPDLLTRQKA